MAVLKREVAFAAISTSSSGNTTLVAAPTDGRKIKVLSYVLVAGGTVNVKFTDGAGGDDLTGAMPLVANSGVSSGEADEGHFQTSADTALVLNLSGAVQVSGHITVLLTS